MVNKVRASATRLVQVLVQGKNMCNMVSTGSTRLDRALQVECSTRVEALSNRYKVSAASTMLEQALQN